MKKLFTFKKISVVLLCSISFCEPIYGQTSGPSTPEVQKFTPSGVNNMVNHFTGDFNYNINILELDSGYPINLSYSSNVNMVEEASNVGFGWQLNIGRINRAVRGLPDDFDGDIITKQIYQKKDWNLGIGAGVGAEIFGISPYSSTSDRLGISGGINFSNIRGVDLESNIGLNIVKKIGPIKLSGGLNLGMSTNEGASISPNAGINLGNNYEAISFGISTKYSSIEGIRAMAISFKHLLQNEKYDRSFTTNQSNWSLYMARTPFTPKIDFPTTTKSGTLKFRGGAEFWGGSFGADVYGNFSSQAFKENDRKIQAFGYLFLQNMPGNGAIMDMASEKETPIFREDPNMNITYLSNDVFSVSAQGLTGTFRPYRTDIGIAHHENISSEDIGFSFGGEVHGGAYFHGGIDKSENSVSNFNGEWRDTVFINKWKFSNLPIYFKNIGEANGFSNDEIFNKLGGYAPKKFNLSEASLTNTLNGIDLNGINISKAEEPRNQVFQYLNGNEACALGNKDIIYSYDGFGINLIKTKVERIDMNRKSNHISFINITKDDGSVYEFGIAAYNNRQKEVSFNINGKSQDLIFSKATLYDNGDNTKNNDKGRTNYFTSTETPAYSYAYLLTAVYSPDYQDLTNDGPSSDDFGTYTKFNYTREYSDFKWRTPYKDANYNAGNLCDKGDDMATYIYGEKEIWMIHSIETKNYIAEFYTSMRNDAYEVVGENGESNPRDWLRSLYKIDSIRLFSKVDFIKNRNTAIPIKTIFFAYDESLCPNIPASKTNGGKLTLKKLNFKYDNSNKEKHSYYSFNYNNENDIAFTYDESKVDRWGSFKDSPDNGRFPYSEQNKLKADRESKAWLLNEIILPIGGKITVDYEAKDYAYVQDKPAMQMFKIVGFSENFNTPPSNVLYENKSSQKNFLFVDVGQNLSDSLIGKLFNNIGKIYINCLVTIGQDKKIIGLFAGNPEIKPLLENNTFEEISGYFEYSAFGKINNTSNIWIQLKPYADINPISRVFWQKMRKSLHQILYPPVIDFESDNVEEIAKNAINGLSNVFTGMGLLDLFKSYEDIMTTNERGKLLYEGAKSFVRLNNINGKKIGGGSRVKQLKIFDNWDLMNGNAPENIFYGQEYNYETEDGNKSSGVATYEPFGIEENPFLMPTGEFNNGNPLAPELYYYKTEPIGESFFPGPSIGYSRVSVKSILPNNVKQNAVGYEVHEFFTSKDFPTITNKTGKEGIPSEISPSSFFNQFVDNYSEDLYTASQGFYVELNDMHGKPKANKYFSQLDSKNPISGTEYRYKVVNGKLDNSVKCINPKTGLIANKNIGLDFDFYISTEESSIKTVSPNVQFNVDVIPLPGIFPFPIPIPTYFTNTSTNKIQYNGVTTTKVVYKTGIIDSVYTYDNGSRIAAKNILYDQISGEPLVVATKNEYEEPIYSTKLPAHWFYDGMGFAFENADMVLNTYDLANVNSIGNFAEADQLLLTKFGSPNTYSQGWIFMNSNGHKSVINEKGDVLLGSYDIVKIIRSGRRNMQSIAVSQILTKTDPTFTNKLKFEQVIDASVSEYQQHWQTYYGLHPQYPKVSCVCSDPIIAKISFFGISPNGELYCDNQKKAKLTGNEIIIKNKKGECDVCSKKAFNPNDETCEIKIKLDSYLPLDSIQTGCKSYLTFDKMKLFDDGECGNKYEAQGEYTYMVSCPNKNPTFIKGKFIITNSCCPLQICNKTVEIIENPLECVTGEGVPVNPYLLGVLGNWRPKTSYKYVANRKYNFALKQKEQGILESFNLYLDPINSSFFETPINKNLWQTADFAEVFDPHGKPIETLNALKLPSSQLYGYDFNLPVALAKNANYYEIAFDGFEDYDFTNQVNSPYLKCQLPIHSKFNFLDSTSSVNYSIDSHTGKKSLLVGKNSNLFLEKKIEENCKFPYIQPNYFGSQYILQKCDLVQDFAPDIPDIGKEFVFSLWMKEKRVNNQLDNSIATVKISLYNATNAIINQLLFKAKGAIVDNWQQLTETFIIPKGATKFKIELLNTGEDMLVDDIRIQPFNSAMKSYVYDPIKLRLMAVLDEENYATFYEYDGEGQLTRTKKETERGIMTIQEVRSSKPKTAKLFPIH